MARTLTRRGTLVVLGMLVLGACGGTTDYDDYVATGEPSDLGAGLAPSATPEQLAFFEQVPDAASAVDRYRAEMWLDASITMDGLTVDMSSDEPVAHIAVAEGRMSMVLELGDLMASMFEQAADEFGDDDMDLGAMLGDLDDWTMEMVVDGAIVYQRQPFLAALGELEGLPGPPAGSFEGALASGDWIRIDAAALGIDPEALAAQQGSGAMGLDQLAELVQGDDLPVEYVGPDEVRGDAVEVYRISTTFGELAALGGGINTQQFALPEFGMADLLATPFEITVSLDGTGVPVRVEMRGDFSISTPEGDLDIEMWQAIEYFDFGDPTISVEVPVDAVDVTEEFRMLVPSALMTA